MYLWKCDRGFMDQEAFKNYKQEEHDYCLVCDEDYQN